MERILIFLYRILTALLVWPAGLALSRHPNFRGTIASRLGIRLPRVPAGRPVVWLHAASMGEVKAVSGLIKALKGANPELFICLSSMTATGRQVASSMPELDRVIPMPFDAGFIMDRYFRKLSPKALVIVETELWPNMIIAAKRLNIPVVIINARMTERSLRRYSLAPRLAERILRNVQVLAMSESDALRFSRLGAHGVKIMGNLKLDSLSQVELSKRDEMRTSLRVEDRPVFIAGSIREGEEEMVLQAVKKASSEVPDLFVILAPRHPGQVGLLAELAGQSGLGWCLRSRMEQETDLLIVDTMGELFNLYGASDAAFVGGSLKDLGGQNILEPIAWGVPVIHGPHMNNFLWALEVVQGFTICVYTPEELGDAIVDIITQPDKYYDLAQEARYLLEKQKGVTARYLDALERYLA